MDDAQVQALMQTWHEALVKQMADMKLRQWCVERAIESLGDHATAWMTGGENPGPITVNFAVVSLSNEILKFITVPFAEIFTPPEAPPS